MDRSQGEVKQGPLISTTPGNNNTKHKARRQYHTGGSSWKERKTIWQRAWGVCMRGETTGVGH